MKTDTAYHLKQRDDFLGSARNKLMQAITSLDNPFVSSSGMIVNTPTDYVQTALNYLRQSETHEQIYLALERRDAALPTLAAEKGEGK